ncbi:trypsin-like serine peptidase [Streptomyces sp. NPDC051217]|uniref:trypsin-like serine peptidase n=1 Tax=Streptomyces sp. NPDC051217 TaxID=3365644 RepID=UPI003793CB9A
MSETSTSLIRRLRGRVLGLAAAGTVLALAAPLTGTAVAGQAGAAATDPVSVMTYSAKERREALAYWTTARMKAVGKSVDLGPTGPKAKPYRGTALKTVGRLFFVNANGADTWCTATAVKSTNRSAVMTAAHCVRRGSSPGNTNTTMVFVPGYSKGKKPYGAFAVRTAATPRTWVYDSTNDVSALVVDADKNGRELTDVVGGQAIAFNRAVGGTISALGYSATRPQLGGELLRCVGTAKKEIGMQAIPCDLTGGSSGGPWLADFDATTGKGVLVSVNASLDSLTPTKMYGEVLGAPAKKVYDRAQKG